MCVESGVVQSPLWSQSESFVAMDITRLSLAPLELRV